MVRLKATYLDDLVEDDLYFNSNMVRLKGVGKPNCTNYSTEFQFQYGSIKSLVSFLDANDNHVFQFQYGSIKRTESISLSIADRSFQFQYGSIKSYFFS